MLPKLKPKCLHLSTIKIVVYLSAMEIVDEPVYGVFARTIATIIAENNEVVKKRSKKETPVEEI